MIEILLSDADRLWSEERLARVERRSVLEPWRFGYSTSRTLAGYDGERAALLVLPGSVLDEDYDHDLVYDGMRYDVKSVSCSARPPTTYLVAVNSSVPGGSSRQDTDRYLFARVLRDRSTAWILGWIESAAFWSRALPIRRGEAMWPGGLVARNADCSVLPISALRSANALARPLRRTST